MSNFFRNPWTQMGVGMLSQRGRIGPGLQQGMLNVQNQQKFDREGQMQDAQRELMQLQAQQAQKNLNQPDLMAVGAGQTLLDKGTMKPAYTAPAAPEKPGAVLAGYQYAVSQGYPGDFFQYQKDLKSAGASSQTVNMGGKGLSELAKKQAGSLVEGQTSAQDDVTGIQNIHSAAEKIQSGSFTGFGANLKLNMARFADFAGLGGKSETEKIANTETYLAQMGNEVGRVIKQFGAGTGLSDADREYAEKIVGGRVTLNKESILRILQIQEKIYRARVDAHNKKAQQVLDKPNALKEMLYSPAVDMTGIPGPLTFEAPAPAAPAGPDIDAIMKKYGG
jgi:hypothetical protein